MFEVGDCDTDEVLPGIVCGHGGSDTRIHVQPEPWYSLEEPVLKGTPFSSLVFLESSETVVSKVDGSGGDTYRSQH